MVDLFLIISHSQEKHNRTCIRQKVVEPPQMY